MSLNEMNKKKTLSWLKCVLMKIRSALQILVVVHAIIAKTIEQRQTQLIPPSKYLRKKFHLVKFLK